MSNKDKHGYEIIDKANKIRLSSENASGTWRDDEYEDLLDEIMQLIEKKYPDNYKMQGSVIISLPSIFATNLLEKEIIKHEKGETPRYLDAGRKILDLHNALITDTSIALLTQTSNLAEYLVDHPKLMSDEKLEELK